MPPSRQAAHCGRGMGSTPTLSLRSADLGHGRRRRRLRGERPQNGCRVRTGLGVPHPRCPRRYLASAGLCDLLMTTNPNLIIYAGIDGWRRNMVLQGHRLLGDALRLAAQVRQGLKTCRPTSRYPRAHPRRADHPVSAGLSADGSQGRDGAARPPGSWAPHSACHRGLIRRSHARLRRGR